jgi:hypothetical protein
MKPTVATAVIEGKSAASVPQELAHFDIKSNDKGDWLVDATIECATATTTTATGKQSKLSGAYAGAIVWYELEGQPISILTGERLEHADNDPIPADATWNLCEQVFEMQSNFNDLIIQCDDADVTAGTCTEEELGQLVFLCDGETELDDNNTECSQSLTIFNKNAGTHGATVMIHDVEGGSSQTVSLMALLSSGGSSESTLESTNVDDESDNFVNAGVIIGKRIVVAEPIHMQTVTAEQ